MSARRASREGLALNPASNEITEKASGQPRITPRNSDGDEAITAAVTKETPWRTLNQLANIPRPTTPMRRASSAGPPSTHRLTRRTPSGQARTPGAASRLGSARRAITVTPHGRAAQRELELRRGLTPGKDRRRSGLQQRETPRDVLRQLSRVLAPISLPVVPTPQGQSDTRLKRSVDDDEDDEDGQVLPRPRFSLPMMGEDDDDDDDSLLLPPHSAGLEDENYTVQSVEMARRAISEQPPGRLSRGSFGSVRMSDIFADLNESGLGGDAYDSSYLAERTFGDLDFPVGDDAALEGELTDTIGRGHNTLVSGRQSDIRPESIPRDDTETTFVFNVPPRDPLEEQADEAEGDASLEQGENSMAADPESEVETAQRGGFDTEDLDESRLEFPEGQEGDISIIDTTMQDTESVVLQARIARAKKVKVSKHGIQYPSLPTGVVKKLATTFARTAGNSKAKISKETLDAIMQASDWFFEQVSDDLGAYASHAGRKTIDESDVVTLMARQRQTNATTTPFSLAQKYLPRELLQELRMVPPSKFKKGRQLASVEEEE